MLATGKLSLTVPHANHEEHSEKGINFSNSCTVSLIKCIVTVFFVISKEDGKAFNKCLFYLEILVFGHLKKFPPARYIDQCRSAGER